MNTKEFKIKVLPLSGKLYRFAKYLLKDMHEAEDAVQEIFLKLWEKRDQLKEINNIDAFAFRMTRNHCLDRLKAKKIRSAGDYDQRDLRETFSAAADPSDQLDLKDAVIEVEKLINDLPEQQRMIIQLRDIEGYEYDEIAKIMDIEVNTIRVNLSRARKSIRDSISKVYQPWKI